MCKEQQCEEEVFYLAMNYVDRFLSIVFVLKCHFQLLGTACLFIASKFRETVPMSAHNLVVYTDNSITIDQLLVRAVLVSSILDCCSSWIEQISLHFSVISATYETGCLTIFDWYKS